MMDTRISQTADGNGPRPLEPDVSIVLPAYNEATRLPPYLASIHEYLDASPELKFEVIVIDDGSSDGTADLILKSAACWPELRLVRHPTNRGKGQALRSGARCARGRLLLFADADGASPIQEEQGLRDAIEAGADIAIGSRLVRDTEKSCRRNWRRDLVGRTFAWAVRRFFQLPARDTQCGFKMFRREVCTQLLKECRERGYLLDLELLILANWHGYRIAEIPISWTDVPGSKVRLLSDGWKMARGLLRMQRRWISLGPLPKPRTAMSIGPNVQHDTAL
jgi:dolichyl-phosphate beta-glucosyltransferase